MKKTTLFFSIFVISATMLTQTGKSQTQNSLSKNEKKQGWTMLFDGKTLDGWKGFNSDKMFGCWSAANGEMICRGEGGSETAGDIITVQQYENFEMSLQWKITKAGNSGIFYHVLEGAQYHAAYETGPEYQLIDDEGWPGGLENWQQTGADYGMYPAKEGKLLKPVGEWNLSKIIYDKGHVEYWLNGMKVVEFQAYSPDWEKKKAASKWKDFPGYAISKKGHIGLQNHGSGVSFRNIKVRIID